MANVRDAEPEIRRLMDETMALQTVCQHIQDLAKGPGATKLLASKQLLESISSELQKEFTQMLRALQPGLRQRAKKKLLRRSLKWPFKKEEMEQILELLERHKSAVVEIGNNVEIQFEESYYCQLALLVY